MQLILARRRADAETWAKTNGHRLADWRRTRTDSTLYVHMSTQLHGRTLTAADTIVVLPGFEHRPNAESIESSIRIAGLADAAGGPRWEGGH